MSYPQVKREFEEQDVLVVPELLLPGDANEEINLLVRLLLHEGHSFCSLFSLKSTINSKLFPQLRHTYSYRGILYSYI